MRASQAVFSVALRRQIACADIRFFAQSAGGSAQFAEKYNDLFYGMELAIIIQLLIHLFMIAPLSG
ncbi:hypothetical protein ACJ2_01000 [Pantoea sp. QMID2]|nr:hypothetical protein ACJ2_01000 [Pantoea sp. QMID2]